MNLLPVIAISLGASLGALLRWVLSLNFNPVYAHIPLGTLAANLLGGYLIGISIAWLGAHAELPVEVRLLIVTGFLGGLTTFSTYSAEVVGLLLSGRYAWALACALLHLIGSFTLTAAGMATYRLLAR
jgi:CrcB protein